MRTLARIHASLVERTSPRAAAAARAPKPGWAAGAGPTAAGSVGVGLRLAAGAGPMAAGSVSVAPGLAVGAGPRAAGSASVELPTGLLVGRPPGPDAAGASSGSWLPWLPTVSLGWAAARTRARSENPPSGAARHRCCLGRRWPQDRPAPRGLPECRFPRPECRGVGRHWCRSGVCYRRRPWPARRCHRNLAVRECGRRGGSRRVRWDVYRPRWRGAALGGPVAPTRPRTPRWGG